MTVFLCRIAAAGLERFGPDAAVGSRKTHGAVSRLLTQGHIELQAEPADKILFLITVKSDTVDEPHRRLARIKIESHGKRQPFAARSNALVQALDFYACTDGAVLLDRDGFDGADKLFARWRVFMIGLRPVLQNAHQLARPYDVLSADTNSLDNI